LLHVSELGVCGTFSAGDRDSSFTKRRLGRYSTVVATSLTGNTDSSFTQDRVGGHSTAVGTSSAGDGDSSFTDNRLGRHSTAVGTSLAGDGDSSFADDTLGGLSRDATDAGLSAAPDQRKQMTLLLSKLHKQTIKAIVYKMLSYNI